MSSVSSRNISPRQPSSSAVLRTLVLLFPPSCGSGDFASISLPLARVSRMKHFVVVECSGSSSCSVHQWLENICFAFQSFCWQLCSLVLEICSFDLSCGTRLVTTDALRVCFTPFGFSFGLRSNPERGSPPTEECSYLQIPSLTLGSPYWREMATLKATIPLECLFSSQHHPVSVLLLILTSTIGGRRLYYSHFADGDPED